MALRCPRLFHFRYVDKIPEPEVWTQQQAAPRSGVNPFVVLFSRAMRRRTVLAIGAHPDDVEIGVAGTLLAHCVTKVRDVLMMEEFGNDRNLMDFLQPDNQQTLGGMAIVADPS